MSISLDPGKIKALAMDLDGTILAPGAVLNERTINTIQRCRQRGLKIIIATGRAIGAVERFRLPLGAEGPMIYFNGALVANMPEGSILSATMLEKKAVELCIDISREMGIFFMAYFYNSSGEIILMAEKDCEEREMYHRHTGLLVDIGDLKEELNRRENCIKAMYMVEPDLMAKLRLRLEAHLGKSVYIAQTLHNFLEIMDAKVSKGKGLKIAMEYLSLNKDEVIAFGDEENDLPMFEAAGFSVAPSNAKEAVKAKAGLVVGSNAEDGVPVFLEQFFAL